jgi:hypothetical protein
MNPFALVARINSLVHLIDPLTLKIAELDTTKARQHETQILGGYSNLILYTILDVSFFFACRQRVFLVSEFCWVGDKEPGRKCFSRWLLRQAKKRKNRSKRNEKTRATANQQPTTANLP